MNDRKKSKKRVIIFSMIVSFVFLFLTTNHILFHNQRDFEKKEVRAAEQKNKKNKKNSKEEESKANKKEEKKEVFQTKGRKGFQEILREANDYHTSQVTGDLSEENLKKYVPDYHDTVYLLSEKEIAELRKDRALAFTTKEMAKKDIDLYFRTLKSSYTAYYFFGEKNFEKAERKILAWIDKQKGKINPMVLSSQLNQNLSFVRDAHFRASGTWFDYVKNRIYHYYFSETPIFDKDEEGFFTEISNTKYYFKSFTHPLANLKRTLLSDGKFGYCPTLWCKEEDRKDAEILLESKEGIKKKILIQWEKNTPIKNVKTDQWFHDFKTVNGVSYLSIRQFDSNILGESVLKHFINTGSQVKDSKLIIFDIRANGGGSDMYGMEWIKKFAGKEPSSNAVYAKRLSLISKKVFNENYNEFGKYDIVKDNGEIIENPIPIIVLVDSECGSSGESMLNYLRAVENTIMIGTNSAGYQLAGNVYGFTLPQTGIPFAISLGSIQWCYKVENVDYKGYAPDVWCSSNSSLKNVFKMLEKEGLMPRKDIERLEKEVEIKDFSTENTNIDENQNEAVSSLYLYWNKTKNIIRENEGFGHDSIGFTDKFTVYFEDRKVSDYKIVSYTKKDKISIKKGKDGLLYIKNIGNHYGYSIITLEYKGKKTTFRWFSGD